MGGRYQLRSQSKKAAERGRYITPSLESRSDEAQAEESGIDLNLKL